MAHIMCFFFLQFKKIIGEKLQVDKVWGKEKREFLRENSEKVETN